MSIEKDLASRLKEAMRSKNTRELDVLRMVKTRGQERKTAPGFKGEIDDAFWTEVIAGYVKQLKKALEEFKKAKEQGKENADKIEFEIEYLTPFLPKLKGEDEVKDLVLSAIEATGATGSNMIGKVVGFVMKDHKDEVDPAMVKRIASEALTE